MQDKEIWDQACKKTLEAIAEAFSDEHNINKAASENDKVVFRALGKKIQDFPIPKYPELTEFNITEFKKAKDVSLFQEGWTDDDMITFSEWYRMWRTHPKVGTDGYSALKHWKELKQPKTAFPLDGVTGLTKREYFAGLAMQGLLSNESVDLSTKSVPDKSIKIADELLKQLESK